jgi:hypothetical protein
MFNHLATNLVTKGLLNISNITKGMLILEYRLVIKKKGGGIGKPPSIKLGYPEEETIYSPFKKDKFFEDIKQIEEIDYIEVRLDKSKKIGILESKLIKTQIEVEILKNTGKKLKVEIIND